MAGRVKTSTRAYHSPLRADQAQRTRRRILDAALRLFADRGYAGTTVAAVAQRAGVVPETIYVSLGGKRGLLEAVIQTAIAGDDKSARQQDALWSEVAELPDPAERLERLVDHSCRILARTRTIHTVIRGAADKEPFAAALERRLLHDRLTAQTERIRRCLGDELQEGLSPTEAGQRYCALASPELYHLLTVEMGWTADQHQSWLTHLLRTDLLGSRGAPRQQRQPARRRR